LLIYSRRRKAPAADASVRASEVRFESLSWEQINGLDPPKRRGRKQSASSVMSLFEWTLSAGQSAPASNNLARPEPALVIDSAEGGQPALRPTGREFIGEAV